MGYLKNHPLLNTLWQSIKSWMDSDPFTQSAATSYYAIFSLPGLLILVIGIAGLFFNQTQVEHEITRQISETFGLDAAENIAVIMEKTRKFGQDPFMIVLGVGTLFFAATGVFVQLQRALNKVWKLDPRRTKSYLKFIKMRLISLSMIIVIGFLLMLSLTLTTVLTAVITWLSAYIPTLLIEGFLALNIVLSWMLTTFLFALMYYVMPDTRVSFKHCIYGGILTAFLFEIGESMLNLYFSGIKPESAFGATGFLILVMIWVFYSCNIVLLGAQFTKTYSDRSHTKD